MDTSLPSPAGQQGPLGPSPASLPKSNDLEGAKGSSLEYKKLFGPSNRSWRPILMLMQRETGSSLKGKLLTVGNPHNTWASEDKTEPLGSFPVWSPSTQHCVPRTTGFQPHSLSAVLASPPGGLGRFHSAGSMSCTIAPSQSLHANNNQLENKSCLNPTSPLSLFARCCMHLSYLLQPSPCSPWK